MNRKEVLKQEISDHRNAISREVEDYKRAGRKIGMAALIGGGAFFLAYSIARGIAAGKKQSAPGEYRAEGTQPVYKAEAAPKKSGFGKKVGGILMTELAILLVGLAKNQIKSYISKLDLSDDE
jgi:hypothetical protein